MDPSADDLAWLMRRTRRERARHAARAPKRLGDVMAQLLARRGYAQVRSAAELESAWTAAVGEPAAAHTRVGALRRGTLEILVAGSAWMQELTFRKQELLDKLTETLPDKKIRNLRFRTGTIQET